MQNKVPKIKEPIKLDLGCGGKTAEGYTGIDNRDCGQDMVWDLKNGLPFPDNSVDTIYSCHFLEHLNDDDGLNLFKDILRVLKSGSKFMCIVPHSSTQEAFYVGHKTFWNEKKVEALKGLTGVDTVFEILENRKQNIHLIFTIRKN